MSASRTPNGPRRAQSARVLARSHETFPQPNHHATFSADASVRSAKSAFDDPSPTLRPAHRRSSLARGSGTPALDTGAPPRCESRREAVRARAAPPVTKLRFRSRYANHYVRCKTLLFVRSANGPAGRSGIPRIGNLTNANPNATTRLGNAEAASHQSSSQTWSARCDRECGAREASDPRLERETSSDPYAR